MLKVCQAYDLGINFQIQVNIFVSSVQLEVSLGAVLWCVDLSSPNSGLVEEGPSFL